MTSSLVGSEMCIRDSQWPAYKYDPACHAALAPTLNNRCRVPTGTSWKYCLLYTSDAADDM
eukprot:11710448-Prorocentrum_lima.AAC.1